MEIEDKVMCINTISE